MFYDFTQNPWNEEEMKALLRVLRTGQFSAGEAVGAFEKQFAAKFGAKYAVMVNSGSSANLLAVASLCYKKERPLKRGDEVIVPALAWSTTYSPLQQFGLKLKFVDIDVATLTMDVNQLERAVTPKTRMIVAVNVLGNPSYLDSIKAVCKSANLYLLEDNCEALGAEFKGIKCGMWGDIGTFSTNFTNHLSTMEGGILVTDDRELYHLAKCMRSYGLTKNLPPESPIYVRKDDPLEEEVRFIYPGFNVAPLEICGAIGTEQLKKIDGILEVRRQNACLFTELFGRDERFVLQRDNGKSSWQAFSLLLNPRWNVDRKKVLQRFAEEGIGFQLLLGRNFAKQDAVRHCDHEIVGELRATQLVVERTVLVGNHAQDLTRQIERLHKIITGIPGAMQKRAA